MSGHHCHALGCKAACPARMLMCGAHWAQVPVEMQREVYRTCKLRGDSADASWAPWWRAQARAIHHVGLLTSPHQTELAARWLARELREADELEQVT